MKSAASVTPEEREKVHKLCAFPWGVSAIPDEVKRMLAEDVDDDPSSAEESEELDFSCSSSSAAASNPNDPQATSDFGQTALTAFQAVKNVQKPLRSARKKKNMFNNSGASR